MNDIIAPIVAIVVALTIYDMAVGLPWVSRVVHVGDGDGVETVTRSRTRRIRLAGIDAPEYRQDLGLEARAELARLVDQRMVLFVPVGRHDTRFVCIMITTGGPVSWRMAMSGLVWPESVMTRLLHLPARFARRGIWAGGAVRPSTWRRGNPSNWSPAGSGRRRRPRGR